MNLQFLSKYFPTPKFLRPPHLGVSFSDSNIKIISFDKTVKEPAIKSVIIPIEDRSIVSGSISNMEEIVKKLLSVKENFDSPFVFFTIPDELAYVFSTSVSVIPGGNLTEAVSFIMEENVPLALSDVIFDFVPTEISKDDSGYSVSVTVAACVKKEAEKFTEALNKAGFDPIGCIPESQAIANSIIRKNYSGISCIVHARQNRIGIHLVKDNLVCFSTLRNISEGDYEKQFLDEYDKFLDYCSKYNLGSQPIKTVLACGEFEYAKAAVEALLGSKRGSEEVKLSNVWSNIFEIDKHLPEIPYEKSLSFAGPIGSIISDPAI